MLKSFCAACSSCDGMVFRLARYADTLGARRPVKVDMVGVAIGGGDATQTGRAICAYGAFGGEVVKWKKRASRFVCDVEVAWAVAVNERGREWPRQRRWRGRWVVLEGRVGRRMS